MFTGIVDHVGRIRERNERAGCLELGVETSFTELRMGESIAVDGVCLTVTAIESWGFRCEISPETLSKSIAGEYRVEGGVNLERSLRLGDRLGGHFVMGHVDRTLRIARRETAGEFVRMVLEGFTPEEGRYLVPKGSVALNGVSLTLNEVWDGGFEIMLIPHTLEITHLSEWKEGMSVNVEFDWMTKTIVNEVRHTRNLLEGKHV